MSVIPDLCDISLDLVFMLDRSGSVGEYNFNTAISFLQSVVSFFPIASNETQVGLVAYSTGASIEFDLNDFQSGKEVIDALEEVEYTEGWTATALALALTRFMLDPDRGYGARPFSDGIPKVAVLLTDGRSNQLPITKRANALRDFGVQVYTVGIGEIYLPELLFIASDPDWRHVFLLKSFNDAEGFIDLLSYTTCDTPAVVEPGENTTTEIEEDEFRFFQSRCAAFSQTIMIEQIDLVGKCALYASSVVQNPGPLDPYDTVVRNENQTSNSRSVYLNLPYIQDRFVFVSVLGKRPHNEFTIVIWDRIFKQDEYTIEIWNSSVATGQEIINLADEIGMTNATFNFTIASGNEGDLFALDPLTGGILTVAQPLSGASDSTFQLTIIAQNREHACHRSKVIINIVFLEENFRFEPLPQPVTIGETAMPGTVVTTIVAMTSGTDVILSYAIIAGNIDNVFSIDPITGVITLSGSLNFEVIDRYQLLVQAENNETGSSITAFQLIIVGDDNETPFFITPCALNNSCSFSVPENEAPGVIVGTVLAGDPDDPLTVNGMLEYALEPLTTPFTVSDSGVISTTQPLDFENTTSHNFTLIVEDGGGLGVETLVIVEVMDVLENTAPVFPVNCSIDVLENIPVGTPFLQCTASDSDNQGNPVVDLTYDIIDGNEDGLFEFNPMLGPGVLVIAGPLDRETRDMYVLTVTATDPEGLSGSTSVTIFVSDSNDNPPSCTPSTNPVLITPSTIPPLPNRVVTIFTAVDPDLEDISPYFSLESTQIDSQGINTNVTVRVTDGEDPTLFSTCTLMVQFEESCFRQAYNINASTGELSSRLFCSAVLDADLIELTEGASRRIFCRILRNVIASYIFLQNGSSITDPLQIRDSDEGGDLILLRVDFEDSGDYVCQAMNNELGVLTSEPVTVNIVVPPSIILPPSDVAANVSQDMVVFQCVASGIPEPTISWFRPNQVEPIVPGEDERFVPTNTTLLITNIELSDAGEYTCEASNTVSTVTASALLTIFSLQQLVVASVPEYFMPSQDGSCHEFNATDFNVVMTEITNYMTMTTSQESDDLCPPSPCNPSPCKNHGECVSDSEAEGGYRCQCPPQYIGRNCEEVTDPCTKAPCLNGGVCASTSRGDFICTCPPGYDGVRCQYTDVCTSSAPCSSDEMCVETVTTSAGYVCVDVERMGEGVSVTVEGGGANTVTSSRLDGEVNSYIETSKDDPRTRRKRAAGEDNGFVNVCEARFVPSTSAQDTFLLVWACPEGVVSPSADDETVVCELLIEQRLVISCTSPQGGRVELPPPATLSPTGVNITFILIDPSTNLPLSGAEALAVLEESNALARLQSTSYRAEGFTAVTPDDTATSSSSDKSGEIAGAVVGTLLSVAVMVAVVMVTVCVVRRRNKKMKKITAETNLYHLHESPQNGNGTYSNHHTITSSAEDEDHSHDKDSSLFDDPIYGSGFEGSGTAYMPPVTTRKSPALERGMRSSLERGMKVIRNKMTSLHHSGSATSEMSLLNAAPMDDDDYDDVTALAGVSPRVPGASVNGLTDEETCDEIYANTQHHITGAMGNAGKRWESYWQTRTLLRSNPLESDTTKK